MGNASMPLLRKLTPRSSNSKKASWPLVVASIWSASLLNNYGPQGKKSEKKRGQWLEMHNWLYRKPGVFVMARAGKSRSSRKNVVGMGSDAAVFGGG